MKTNWNRNEETTFEEFLDVTAKQLEHLFGMFGWKWSIGESLVVPNYSQIRNHLIKIITKAFEDGTPKYDPTGRIGVMLNQEDGLLDVFVEISSFFGDPCEVDEDVDVLFPGLNDTHDVGSD